MKLLIVFDGLKDRGLIKNILDGRFVKLNINDHRSIVWCLKEKRGKKNVTASYIFTTLGVTTGREYGESREWWDCGIFEGKKQQQQR